MKTTKVILTGRMANAGRIITKEEKAEREAQAQMEKESARIGGRVYIFTNDTEVAEEEVVTPLATIKEEMDKCEEEISMERPVRLAEVDKVETLVEKARRIKKEMIESEINKFWEIVNESEANVANELLNRVAANPLKEMVSYSFSVEIDKNGFEELIVAAIESNKENFKEYWSNEGVNAEITTFSKDKNIKVVFSYSMTY